jgi:hypothetical protein
LENYGEDDMSRKNIVELLELDQKRKWAYLKRFYEVASEFYRVEREQLVSDEEVQECIRKLKRKPAPRIRKQRSLGEWRFRLDEKDAGLREQYYSAVYDESGWELVKVPHSINHVPADPVRYGRTRYFVLAPEEGMYWDIYKGESSSWYKTRIPMEPVGAEEVAYLSFESVNLLADVWVNENPVMMSHLGLFPFQMEITEELRTEQGQEAVIAVKVGNQATNTPYLFYSGLQVAYGNPPYTDGSVPMDSLDEAWAGIAGDATLRIVNRNHIQDVFLFTEDIVQQAATVACRVELRNESWRRFAGTIRVEVGKWHPQEGDTWQAAAQEVTVLPMNDARADIRFQIEDPQLWDIDNPNLYLAHITLLDREGREIDDAYESFGVRTIKMRGAHFYLNGKKIVPRGTHNTANYFKDSLICPSDRNTVMDMLLHKRMNATCSRWPSDIRMHHKRIAEYADQLGFMLSWTGYFEMWLVHPEMELYAQRDARAMVRSLRNHPSIIIWEMGDEPLMRIHDHRRLRWYEQIYNLVAEEDQSRPIIPAGYYSNELVELITDYPAKSLSAEQRRRRVLEDHPVFTRKLAPWDFHYCPTVVPPKPTYTVVDSVREALGGERPTIFTEFGLDGMPDPQKVRDVYGKFRWAGNQNWYNDKDKEDTHYYGRRLQEKDWRENQAAQAIVLSGIIGRLREYPDDFAAFYFLSFVDPWIFYWGVLDANFNPKLSYFVVQQCYGSLYVSGLHGSTVMRRNGKIDVTISNFGESLSGASLTVLVKDERGKVKKNHEFQDLTIAGNVALTTAAELEVKDLEPGLYSIEFEIRTGQGPAGGRRVELFFLEE